MKKQFVIITELVKNNCISAIKKIEADGRHSVVITPTKNGKTIAQLNGLFGVWVSYISDIEGDSVAHVHRRLKAMFLARIYISEPIGNLQEQWVELLAKYQECGDNEMMMKHAGRISLAWASISQMREYMNAIECHYISVGMPLPIIDRFKRAYNA